MHRNRTILRALAVACSAGTVLAVATVTSTPSAAAAPTQAPPPLSLPCAGYPSGDTICSGEVRSFDGSPLDVDVTVPHESTGATHPLMVMFHGFGNNKHEWESTTDEGDGADKYHWNSHWFAEHGYYVLTYTARGFTDQGPTRADEPNTPAGTDPTCHPPTVPSGSSAAGSDCAPSGTIRVKNKDVEIRDSQYLAALTAAAFPDVDPNRVAVSGGSYGGGEAWLQAAEPIWTFPHSVNSALPVLQLQVAIPKYGWTDLAYSLVPNGHPGFLPGDPAYSSSQGAPNAHGIGNPVGVAKASYIAGLYALGTTTGTFEEGTSPTPVKPPPCTAPETFTTWLGRVAAGEPYDVAGVDDPVVAQIRQDFSDCHSAYYQPGWRAQQQAGHETAVFAIQGWTDDLFEAVESFRMFKYLKTLDPLWPVAVGVADVGHSRAQNKPSTWQRLNNQANQFLFAQISGSHQQQTTVFSEATLCPNNPDTPDQTAAQQLTATTPEGLANGTLNVVGPRRLDGQPAAGCRPRRARHGRRRPEPAAVGDLSRTGLPGVDHTELAGPLHRDLGTADPGEDLRRARFGTGSVHAGRREHGDARCAGMGAARCRRSGVARDSGDVPRRRPRVRQSDRDAATAAVRQPVAVRGRRQDPLRPDAGGRADLPTRQPAEHDHVRSAEIDPADARRGDDDVGGRLDVTARSLCR